MYAGLSDSDEIIINEIANSFDESSCLVDARNMKEIVDSCDDQSILVDANDDKLTNSFDESTSFLDIHDKKAINFPDGSFFLFDAIEKKNKKNSFSEKLNLGLHSNSQGDKTSEADTQKRKNGTNSLHGMSKRGESDDTDSGEDTSYVLDTQDDVEEEWSFDKEDDCMKQEMPPSVQRVSELETPVLYTSSGDKKEDIRSQKDKSDCKEVALSKNVTGNIDKIDATSITNVTYSRNSTAKLKKPRQRYKVRFFSYPKKSEVTQTQKPRPKKQYFEIHIRPPRTKDSTNIVASLPKPKVLSTVPIFSSSRLQEANLAKKLTNEEVEVDKKVQRVMEWGNSRPKSKENSKEYYNRQEVSNVNNSYRHQDTNASNAFCPLQPMQAPKMNIRRWISKFFGYLKREKSQPTIRACGKWVPTLLSTNPNYLFYGLDRRGVINEIHNITQRINVLTQNEFRAQNPVYCDEIAERFGSNRSNIFPFVSSDAGESTVKDSAWSQRAAPTRDRILKRKIAVGTQRSSLPRMGVESSSNIKSEKNINQHVRKSLTLSAVARSEQRGKMNHNIKNRPPGFVQDNNKAVHNTPVNKCSGVVISGVLENLATVQSRSKKSTDSAAMITSLTDSDDVTGTSIWSEEFEEGKNERCRTEANPGQNAILESDKYPPFLDSDSEGHIFTAAEWRRLTVVPFMKATPFRPKQPKKKSHKERVSLEKSSHEAPDYKRRQSDDTTPAFLDLPEDSTQQLRNKSYIFDDDFIRKSSKMEGGRKPQSSQSSKSFVSLQSGQDLSLTFIEVFREESKHFLQKLLESFLSRIHSDSQTKVDNSVQPTHVEQEPYKRQVLVDECSGSRSYTRDRPDFSCDSINKITEFALGTTDGNRLTKRQSFRDNPRGPINLINGTEGSQSMTSFEDGELGELTQNEFQVSQQGASAKVQENKKSIHRVSTQEEEFLMQAMTSANIDMKNSEETEAQHLPAATSGSKAISRNLEEKRITHIPKGEISKAEEESQSLATHYLRPADRLAAVTSEEDFLLKTVGNVVVAPINSTTHSVQNISSKLNAASRKRARRTTTYAFHQQENCNVVNTNTIAAISAKPNIGQTGKTLPNDKVLTKETDTVTSDARAEKHDKVQERKTLEEELAAPIKDHRKCEALTFSDVAGKMKTSKAKKAKKNKIVPCCGTSDSAPSSPYNRDCFGSTTYRFHPVISVYNCDIRKLPSSEKDINLTGVRYKSESSDEGPHNLREKSGMVGDGRTLITSGQSNAAGNRGDVTGDLQQRRRRALQLTRTANPFGYTPPNTRQRLAVQNARFHPHISKNKLTSDIQRSIIMANGKRTADKPSQEAGTCLLGQNANSSNTLPPYPLRRTAMAERMGNLNTAIISKMQPSHDDLQAIRNATRDVRELARQQELRLMQQIGASNGTSTYGNDEDNTQV